MTRLARISRPLLPLLLLAVGCASSLPADNSPASPPRSSDPGGVHVPAPAGPQPAPRPVPEAPPAEPGPVPEPAPPATAKTFSLSPADVAVSHKGRVQVDLVNTTDATHRYHHPGGSSGCAAFRWSVKLVAEDGTIYDRDFDHPGRLCTAVMIPASDYAFKAGEVAAQIDVNVGIYHYAYKPDDSVAPFSPPPPPVVVPKGRYRLVVSGAGVTAEGKLTVR